MEPWDRVDVFRFLVYQGCKQAAAGMWFDLFEGRLHDEIERGSDASELGAKSVVDAIAASDVGNELRQMFEWLASVAFHWPGPTIDRIPSETVDVANWVRQEITRGSVKKVNEWNGAKEWPPVFAELLMRLWDDGFGNLLFRTIREVRGERPT